MTGDLFSAGFAWGDEPQVSQTVATPAATPSDPAFPSVNRAVPADSKGRVAGVAGVADIRDTPDDAPVSHGDVAQFATVFATPETADFRAAHAPIGDGVANVASVANWRKGVAVLAQRRTAAGDTDLRMLQADATSLLNLWGEDLIKAGWSTLDVWGSNANPAHRRLDRLGLIHFVAGGRIEAIDSDTATIAHGRDHLTFYRTLIARGGVPIWAVSEGENPFLQQASDALGSQEVGGRAASPPNPLTAEAQPLKSEGGVEWN